MPDTPRQGGPLPGAAALRAAARRAAALGVAGLCAAGFAGLSVTAGELDGAIGRALFRRAWVPAPSSTRAADGLGPLFNARACASCHVALDRAPVALGPGGAVASEHLVLRFSDPAGRPDPVYGRQLQLSSVPGVVPEARGLVRDADGSVRPDGLAYGPLDGSTRAGGRIAPALRGLGLLAQVPDEAIAAGADANRRHGKGVQGRVNWITDTGGARRAGRFGWKAGQATLAGQVEFAFALDLGLSTPGRPNPAGDCTPAQTACLAAPHGASDEGPEIPAGLVDRLTAFLASVPPSAPHAPDAAGEAVFSRTGCGACHAPSLPSPGGPVRAFSDLLLHDLGPGLDGGATEPGVAATEWRTAPLWGMSQTVRAAAGLLHDGRARSVAEAVALHGGEGADARAAFGALNDADRAMLIAFVEGL